MESTNPILVQKIKYLRPHLLNQLILLFKDNGWQTTKRYVIDFLKIKQNYLYIIEQDNQLIATVFFADYLNRIWVGHSFTAIKFRGKGFNSLIKKQIIIDQKDVPLFLTCRDELINLNAKLGFKNLGLIYEIQLKLSGNKLVNSNNSDYKALLDFDRSILGGNRDEKLIKIMNSKQASIFLRKFKEEIDSYALISCVNGNYRIGPLVSANIEVGLDLLLDLINYYQLPMKTVNVFTQQQHIRSIMSLPGYPQIVNKLNLLSTGNLETEIHNQLLYFGRASG